MFIYKLKCISKYKDKQPTKAGLQRNPTGAETTWFWSSKKGILPGALEGRIKE